MKSMSAALVLVLLAATLAGMAERTPGLTFHFFQHPGSTRTSILGVSNRNVAVGDYYDRSGVQHGFMVTSSGVFTTIDHPNGIGTTVPWGINSSGVIVGRYGDSQNFQAFSYDHGVFQDIAPPSGHDSAAYGINDLGQIAGDFEDVDQVLKGWVFDGTKYRTLVVPGSIVSHATGVNLHGIVTLQWLDAAFKQQSSIFDGTTYRTLNVPGAAISLVHALDSAAPPDLMYEWIDGAFHSHGALFSHGKFNRFDAPGCDNTVASGINDHHVIVGTCYSSSSNTYSAFYVVY